MPFFRRRKHITTIERPRPRPEGTLVPTPLRRHRVYRLDTVSEAYQVWHGTHTDERIDVHRYGSTLEDVIEHYGAREAREDLTERTRANGRPRDLCRLGWHIAGSGIWFRLANKGVPGTLIVYWAGSRPEECFCSALKSFGGRTLRCRVCGMDVDKDHDVLEETR